METAEKTPLVRKYPKYQRNDPCPCGSGKKFKHCCEKAYQVNLQQKVITVRHNHMKDEILDYFKTDRGFESGVKLFMKYSRNMAYTKMFNLRGESKKNIEILHYQLWKLTGEPESEMIKLMQQPVKLRVPYVKPLETPDVEIPTPIHESIIPSPTDIVKKKLRDEFPFLADKNCPDAFKILVADMLTAYDNYVKSHDELYNVKDEKEAFDVSDKLVDNYLENQAIWEELNHYKATGKILGKHPYFEEQNRRKELAALSSNELHKLKENFEMNLWRNKKKLQADPKPQLLKSRQAKIEIYERDLGIVKTLLNITD